MSEEKEILIEELSGHEGNVGVITLNRPQVLNSLNYTMVIAIHQALQSFAISDQIKAVVIRAAPGRAFCAGGDLRLTYERAKEHSDIAPHFFRDEYHLNSFIHHYPKPYIALLDGITMGGGVGISIHGSHRVATENLIFAMPETGIGFFPDVGGTYFLPRLPRKTGFYLGLTGSRIASDDAVALGLATQKVAHDALPELLQTLAKTALGRDAGAAVTGVIQTFQTPVKSSSILDESNDIETCFGKNTMEDIVHALKASPSQLCHEAVAAIEKKSPSSLKITLRALQQGSHLDFDACMRQEYRLATRFLQSHDFLEGIRAVIIDKDQKPIWKPTRLSDVTENEIEKYFAPLTAELTQ